MLGAIIGDIIGSPYEWNNVKTKGFELFSDRCRFTDDTVMTLAIAHALMESAAFDGDLSSTAVSATAVYCMRYWGKRYLRAGYGAGTLEWICKSVPAPYNSYGNGAAMRVSACGWAATSLEEAIRLSKAVTEVTHNHPEGIKGAESVAVAIFLARTRSSQNDIRDYIDKHHYSMDFTLDSIRDAYSFDVSCQGSVPQAIMAFLESTSFEDAVRNAVSLGGDSDTIAAITGSIAEAYYGIPVSMRNQALTHLTEELKMIIFDFEEKFPPKIV